MAHLLVTNDFPPKVGGIQTYLWELWRRLPPGEVTVLTTAFPGAEAWDRDQPFRVVRSRHRVLAPTPGVLAEVADVTRTSGAGLVVLDPAFPLGCIGPRLSARTGVPYGVVLHGAEVTIPGRLPVTRALLSRVLRGAAVSVCAGTYPLAEGERAARAPLPHVLVPPGVDVDRFVPVASDEARHTRRRFGLPEDAALVLGVSRLVPRKGFDVLIRAAASLAAQRPLLHVAIAGAGRDRDRLEQLAQRLAAPVTFLGRVDDDDLPRLYGAADVFAMVCRDRWMGLEQEGFGIVFLEAAAAGVPSVAGRSGGAHDAVLDGRTGLVVADPTSVVDTARALARLLDDPARRAALGRAGRERTVEEFRNEALATRLLAALRAAEDRGHATSRRSR